VAGLPTEPLPPTAGLPFVPKRDSRVETFGRRAVRGQETTAVNILKSLFFKCLVMLVVFLGCHVFHDDLKITLVFKHFVNDEDVYSSSQETRAQLGIDSTFVPGLRVLSPSHCHRIRFGKATFTAEPSKRNADAGS
jgi:hypothetical protein